jgi:hypothetical protein
MPRQDGTGPSGQGPMTGRGMGPCGRGMRKRFGRGFGRGQGRFAVCPPKYLAGFTKEEEKKILKADLEDLEAEKQEIEKRLKKMK